MCGARHALCPPQTGPGSTLYQPLPRCGCSDPRVGRDKEAVSAWAGGWPTKQPLQNITTWTDPSRAHDNILILQEHQFRKRAWIQSDSDNEYMGEVRRGPEQIDTLKKVKLPGSAVYSLDWAATEKSHRSGGLKPQTLNCVTVLEAGCAEPPVGRAGFFPGLQGGLSRPLSPTPSRGLMVLTGAPWLEAASPWSMPSGSRGVLSLCPNSLLYKEPVVTGWGSTLMTSL